MILRRCAGGVVFYANKVLLVKNDRNEWTLPKGKIGENELPNEIAPAKVKKETGIDAKVLDMAGDTVYEFYSRTRQQEVCNAIVWYIMESQNTNFWSRNRGCKRRYGRYPPCGRRGRDCVPCGSYTHPVRCISTSGPHTYQRSPSS